MNQTRNKNLKGVSPAKENNHFKFDFCKLSKVKKWTFIEKDSHNLWYSFPKRKKKKSKADTSNVCQFKMALPKMCKNAAHR